ncbi:MAG TPA: protein-L-isoaspartate O-methyltransferase [Methylovirgula sp.]|jgi:protein-L-isoaspartate(D-aspartate) O-methyltransferase
MSLSLAADPAFESQRRTMVDRQIRPFDVTEHVVIARFVEVPREIFLPKTLVPFAYSDMALKIPREGRDEPRTMLSPAVLARLIQAAAIKPSDTVLDVAAATGYSTAILSGLAARVTALESSEAKAAIIKANLARLGIANARAFAGTLTGGVAGESPFDVIIVNGTVEAHLEQLFQQLRSGGRLITIVRKTTAPGYGASHAVRFESLGAQVSSSFLFDSDGTILTAFRKEPEFVF